MDQPEEILEKLERFNVQKNPEITRELNEYVSFVARTGDSVFAWPLVKKLYREKLNNVITEFNETPTKELPQYPNVDPFNYDTMKKMLIERLESFSAAPFTIQRISELLSEPRKQYSRIDKFMRAVEKNILVVSTVSPGRHREESENGDSLDSALNGDFSSEVNVDIDMENDGSFTMTKEFNVATHRKEPTHDILTVAHDTVTIKKIATKEEASTSAIAVEKNGEPLQGTQTDIKIDSQAAITITVNESAEESKSELSPQQKVDEAPEPEILAKESVQSEEILEKVEMPQEPIVPSLAEIPETNIGMNEPLRTADNEILVDTSDIISETTPLAALENIVANRTDPSIAENIEPQIRIEQQAQEIEQHEQKESELQEEESDCIEAKRIKIEEIESTVLPEKEDDQSDVKTPVIQSPPEDSITEIKSPITEEPETVEVQPEVLITPNVEITTPIPIIEEVTQVEEEIPVVIEPIVEELPVSAATEIIPTEQIVPVQTEMEVLIPAVENPNTMALDEDEPSPPQELEMTPVANKMDTDENEGEAALMDVDDEPMDQ